MLSQSAACGTDAVFEKNADVWSGFAGLDRGSSTTCSDAHPAGTVRVLDGGCASGAGLSVLVQAAMVRASPNAASIAGMP
jgi:hypothetical protein